MTDVHLRHLSYTQIQVIANPGIIMELADTLTFFAENYRYHPRFRSKVWDGKICLINRMTGVIYAGLAQRIKKFCDSNEYSFSFDDELLYDNVSVKEVEDHLDSLKLPDWLERREYQVDAIVKCLRSRRRTLISPTSSGKSLIIYAITSWYKEHKALIITPTTGLVAQMESDLRSYGFEGTIATSIGGIDKAANIDADIVITTWQSLSSGKRTMPKGWYDQFGVVVADEAHHAKATELIKILSAMENTPYRFGTTGTLGDHTLNRATIEGLFGPLFQTTTTKKLMDTGHVSKLKIKCIVLKYPEAERKEFNKSTFDPKAGKNRKKTYAEEIDYISNSESRMKFIKNLALSLKGNKLVFFRLKEHGKALNDALEDLGNIFYIDGDVKAIDREKFRHAMEDEENAILVGSLGTISAGFSVKRLHHMIAASPSKSKIKVLQSIGRMLRQHEEKTHAVLYDIVDDLSYKSSRNFTLNHFEERTKIYDAEEFDYRIYNVGLK
jgi:superfamily II DNA or RNA helicase